MIHIPRSALIASLLLLAASPIAAQERSPSAPRVYGGLSVGPQMYPDELQPSCGEGSFGVAEARVGAGAGLFALEVRGAAVLAYAGTACLVAIANAADLAPPPTDGVQTYRELGWDEQDPAASFDARLRFGGTREMPLVVSVGGGRLFGPGLSYAAASVGFRTRGTTRVALDLEGNLYHLTFDDVQVEYAGGQLVRTISRESNERWSRGVGLRLGVERDLF